MKFILWCLFYGFCKNNPGFQLFPNSHPNNILDTIHQSFQAVLKFFFKEINVWYQKIFQGSEIIVFYSSSHPNLMFLVEIFFIFFKIIFDIKSFDTLNLFKQKIEKKEGSFFLSFSWFSKSSLNFVETLNCRNSLEGKAPQNLRNFWFKNSMWIFFKWSSMEGSYQDWFDPYT